MPIPSMVLLSIGLMRKHYNFYVISSFVSRLLPLVAYVSKNSQKTVLCILHTTIKNDTNIKYIPILCCT
jgi:hypothetical protein